MAEAAYWWVNQVQVETFTGGDRYGPRWADSVTVDCWVEAGAKEVRATTGEVVVSTTSIYGPLDQADLFTADSKVTVNGATARVLTLDRFDSGSLALGLDHFVANLT